MSPHCPAAACVSAHENPEPLAQSAESEEDGSGEICTTELGQIFRALGHFRGSCRVPGDELDLRLLRWTSGIEDG